MTSAAKLIWDYHVFEHIDRSRMNTGLSFMCIPNNSSNSSQGPMSAGYRGHTVIYREQIYRGKYTLQIQSCHTMDFKWHNFGSDSVYVLSNWWGWFLKLQHVCVLPCNCRALTSQDRAGIKSTVNTQLKCIWWNVCNTLRMCSYFFITWVRKSNQSASPPKSWCVPLKWTHLMCLPLLIIAGLLPATVQSHHPVAFAPHILAHYPLGWVAWTSPEKRHSFFQLNSEEKEQHLFMKILLCSQKDPRLSESLDISSWSMHSSCAHKNKDPPARPAPHPSTFTLSRNTSSRWFTAPCSLQKMSQLFSRFWSYCFRFPRGKLVVLNTCLILCLSQANQVTKTPAILTCDLCMLNFLTG